MYTSNGRVQLPKDLNLNGEWEVALSEIHTSTDQKYLLVTADFVDSLIVGDRIVKLLRKVHRFDLAFYNLYYVRVVSRYIHCLNIQIFNENNIEISEEVDLVLHFRSRSLY